MNFLLDTDTCSAHMRPPSQLADLLREVHVLDFYSACAERFGEVRGTLLQKGLTVSRMDLLIASVAMVHDLTLVTHNTADYQNIPGLRLDDWLIP